MADPVRLLSVENPPQPKEGRKNDLRGNPSFPHPPSEPEPGSDRTSGSRGGWQNPPPPYASGTPSPCPDRRGHGDGGRRRRRGRRAGPARGAMPDAKTLGAMHGDREREPGSRVPARMSNFDRTDEMR